MISHSSQRASLLCAQEELLSRPNSVDTSWYNGVFERYQNPVLTAAHVPIDWRYDLNPATNPNLQERLAVNAVFNSGALEWNGGVVLIARVEGADRKSFFAVAESPTGTDNFRFWAEPARIPEISINETNIYDMRLTRHEDGWIYGLFCSESKDPEAAPGDESSAVAGCGIVRTRDLLTWERLPNLKTSSSQQRNVVLHPEFVDGKYALYTRPQDSFIEAGKGGGIGWGLTDSMEAAFVGTEIILDPKKYHTIKEVKNGQGPAPIKTAEGWLHLAHGVRNTAAGLRYVLYIFLTALDNPAYLIRCPGGYFIAPEGAERVGDVSNVVFSNGWVAMPDGRVLIYYGSSDTRMHVATSEISRLVDYALNTPEDPGRSAASVAQRYALIAANRRLRS